MWCLKVNMRRVKVKLCLVILGILVIVGIMVIKLNGYENSRYKQNRSNQGKCIANIESSKESNNSGYRVDYVNDEAYLLNNGEKVAGPYLYIYSDFEESYIKECRYVGENHKIGYIDSNGHEIISPKYIEASKMSYNRALVKESLKDGYYFINT